MVSHQQASPSGDDSVSEGIEPMPPKPPHWGGVFRFVGVSVVNVAVALLATDVSCYGTHTTNSIESVTCHLEQGNTTRHSETPTINEQS